MEVTATAGELLLAARSFPFASLGDLLGAGGLLVVAPHPDDESLACGGLIAESCSQNRLTRVIVVSDGTGSHPRSKAYPKDALQAITAGGDEAGRTKTRSRSGRCHFLGPA